MYRFTSTREARFTLSTPIATSAVLTAITFFLIGVFKGRVVHRPLLSSGLETLFIGSAAAGLSYVVGLGLRSFAG